MVLAASPHKLAYEQNGKIIHASLSQALGIPLTAEILTDNLGFEDIGDFYDDLDKCYSLKDKWFVTFANGVYEFGLGFHDFNKPIKYVHELQNLLFVFAEIEIEFKTKEG